jgi:predicted transcriptional regulator
MRRAVIQAVADPNRRAILSMLVNKNLTLYGVAENFHISCPAVFSQIKTLTEYGYESGRLSLSA